VSTITAFGGSLLAFDVEHQDEEKTKTIQWDDDLRCCASRYSTWAQLSADDSPPFVPISDELGMLIADRYVDMPHEPDNPLVRASYQRYIQEITEQYEFAVEWLGLRVEPWPHASEPYRDSREMIEDVRRERHLYFLATSASRDEATTHLMRTPTGIVVGGAELPADDVFRVVHDVFGHAKEGHQFGPIGEERAWLEHYGMFSPLARPALTAETRGQTCWMYYGPHLRDTAGTLIGRGEPGWIPVPQRPYAERKAGLLPAELSGVRLTREPETDRVRAEPLAGWRPDTCRA
jgi:hypothetical protein